MKAKKLLSLSVLLVFAMLCSAQTFTTIDVCPGVCQAWPEHYTLYQGKMYFHANDAIYGYELWVSDGTAAGTHIVADINPGAPSSTPRSICVLNNMLVFKADDGTHGIDLWTSDGTSQGTHMVKDIIYTGYYQQAGILGELYAIDGLLYFTGNSSANGSEPWVSDGTEAGTFMLKDISTGTVSSAPDGYKSYNGRVFFAAPKSAYGIDGLWSTDGTPAGTQFVAEIDYNVYNTAEISTSVIFNNKLYFITGVSGLGLEVWVTDGTDSGTAIVRDLAPGSASSYPSGFAVAEHGLCLSARDTVHGDEIWVIDSAQNMFMLRDIWPGFKGSRPQKLTAWNGKVYFMADDSLHGAELWVTDGTFAGTYLLKDIAIGIDGSYPEAFMPYHNKLHFKTGGALGQLGVTDGTGNGTQIILNQSINVSQPISDARHVPFVLFNDALVTTAEYNNNGNEIWFFNDAPLAVENITGEHTYSVFPNPFTQTITINGLKNGETYNVSLLDMAGRQLQKQVVTAGATSTPINMAPLSVGIYLLQVQKNESTFVLKVARE